jgi:hypothetical protein
MNDLEQQLQMIRPTLTDREREALWSSIAYRLTPRSARVSRRFRATVAGTIAVSLFFSGLLTVYASDAAVPGDVLYPVDRAVEQVRLAVAPTVESRERIRIEQAYERLEEVRIILERNSADDEADDDVLDGVSSSSIIAIVDSRVASATNAVDLGGIGRKTQNADDDQSLSERARQSPKLKDMATSSALAPSPGSKNRSQSEAIDKVIMDLRRSKESMKHEDRREEIEEVVRKIEEVKREKEREIQERKREQEVRRKAREETGRQQTQAREENLRERPSTEEEGSVRTVVRVSLPHSPSTTERATTSAVAASPLITSSSGPVLEEVLMATTTDNRTREDDRDGEDPEDHSSAGRFNSGKTVN